MNHPIPKAISHGDPPPPQRCPWCGTDPLYTAYHDQEWGRPRRDERAMFEFLVLESAQAGLSWITILRKREGYRQAFAQFDPERIALYGPADAERLMSDPGIVRNKMKIAATIANARAELALLGSGRSLSALVWARAGSRRPCAPQSLADVPIQTPESEDLARELKTLGFKHVGPIVAYSLMQAMGVVDDHLASCFLSNPTPNAPSS